jgi:hypothetical protein
MTTKIASLLFLAAIAGAACYLLACGYMEPAVYFKFQNHPDLPFTDFASGKLGILQPAYARSYLYVAYRQMIGLDFSADEKKILDREWKLRIAAMGGGNEGGNDYNADPAEKAFKEWLKARLRVRGISGITYDDPDARIFREVPGSSYWGYPNCLADGFRTAVATLDSRIQRFGAGSREVREWLRGQDVVFSNCRAGEAVPAAAPKGIDPLIVADRDYQTAAALFYAGKFDAARTKFAAIAQDSSSPWHGIAPFLAARCLLRQATLSPDSAQTVLLLKRAASEMDRLLGDPSRAEFHPSVRRLMKTIMFRLYPDVRFREVETSLLAPRLFADFDLDLRDYLRLLDAKLDSPDSQDDLDKFVSVRLKTEIGPMPPSSVGEMTQWIEAFQRGTFADSLEIWKHADRARALPWLVAAISKAQPDSSGVSELIEAAGKVPRDSPGFATVNYHRVRLLAATAGADRGREAVEQVISADGEFPRSARNLFLEQRLTFARSLDEFLRDAQRIPAAAGSSVDGTEELLELSPPKSLVSLFDEDAAQILNGDLPLTMLVQAAGNATLSAALRERVARAAWVRAILLDRPELAHQAKPALPLGGEPAILYILRTPGMSPWIRAGLDRQTPLRKIDSYRDNWWCKLHPVTGDRLLWHPPVDSKKQLPAPHFLSPTELSAATEESARLDATVPVPDYLGYRVLEWAKKSPADPNLPELLALVVRATRYPCSEDAETSRISRTAYALLHRRFPDSEWAKKTPYFF